MPCAAHFVTHALCADRTEHQGHEGHAQLISRDLEQWVAGQLNAGVSMQDVLLQNRTLTLDRFRSWEALKQQPQALRDYHLTAQNVLNIQNGQLCKAAK